MKLKDFLNQGSWSCFVLKKDLKQVLAGEKDYLTVMERNYHHKNSVGRRHNGGDCHVEQDDILIPVRC